MTLAEQVGFLRRTLHRLLTERLAERTTRSFLELRALSAIAYAEAPTQAELARRVLVDAAAASRLVDRLAAEGLVERREGKDRRCVRLALTRRGRADLEVLEEILQGVDREVRKHLSTAEMRQLVTLMAKLDEGLERWSDRPRGKPAACEE
jgi:DNA-binding MarR family transcriptional regulator